MPSDGKLIGTFGPAVDVKFSGAPSDGVICLIASNLKIDQDFTLRVGKASWRIRIIEVSDTTAKAKIIESL
jgi:hypothetical protein